MNIRPLLRLICQKFFGEMTSKLILVHVHVHIHDKMTTSKKTTVA